MKTDEISISGGVITTEQVIFFEGFCDDGGMLFKDVFHIFPKDFLNERFGFDSFDKNRRSESCSDSIYAIKLFSNSADELGGANERGYNRRRSPCRASLCGTDGEVLVVKGSQTSPHSFSSYFRCLRLKTHSDYCIRAYFWGNNSREIEPSCFFSIKEGLPS